VYHYNGIEIPGGVPAIVSEDTFKAVERRMAKNKHASAKNKAPEKYLLTTKLFCGKCHSMMVGDSAQKKNGNIYRYYKCASAKRHECDKKAVRKEWIEGLVLNKVIKVLFDDEALDKIADEIVALLDEDNKVIPLLEAQLKEVRKSIDNVMKAIEAGIITRSTKAKLEELEAQEEQIELNILKEQTSSPKLTKEQILFALDKFRKLDLTIEANKERLIDSLVKCVLLYDDKLVITFNFKNEPVTVPTSDELEEIEGSSDIKAFAFLLVPHTLIDLAPSASRDGVWVRNIAPPLPRRKPRRAEQIPAFKVHFDLRLDTKNHLILTRIEWFFFCYPHDN